MVIRAGRGQRAKFRDVSDNSGTVVQRNGHPCGTGTKSKIPGCPGQFRDSWQLCVDCFFTHTYTHTQAQGVHDGKRKGFMVANISCFKLTTSMAKQRLSSGSVDKVTRCARALTHQLTISKVLVSVFELDASSDDGSEI